MRRQESKGLMAKHNLYLDRRLFSVVLCESIYIIYELITCDVTPRVSWPILTSVRFLICVRFSADLCGISRCNSAVISDILINR